MTPKIETRLVADLIPYAANSRTHSDAQVAQIAASIKEFGWTNPILIDGDNTIIAGHGRLLAARKLGMEEVPAIILDHLTKSQQRALVIADNQLALNAGWDIDMLKAEIEDLNLEGFDLGLLGFDDKFLDGLLEPEPSEGLTDEDAVEFISAFRLSGFKQARPSTIQWVKPSLTMSQGDYHSQNEPCLFGWKEGSGRVRVKDRKQTTIWHCDRTTEAKVHPTMKPVELCQRAIENSSVANCIVLDLFGGSGSTLIACEKTNRQARLMELDPKYCDVIIKRWQDFTGQQAVHAETGETFDASR